MPGADSVLWCRIEIWMTLHTVETRWANTMALWQMPLLLHGLIYVSKGTQCQHWSCNVIICRNPLALMTSTILIHVVPGYNIYIYTWIIVADQEIFCTNLGTTVLLAGGPRSATYGVGAQRGISLLLQSIGLHKARIVGLCGWHGARDILRQHVSSWEWGLKSWWWWWWW